MSSVVKVFDKAALMWPMHQQDDVLSLDMDIVELTWACCVCLDDILVAPTAPCSPVELAILGLENKSGFYFKQVGPTIDVLKWQASVGFVGVPEAAMKLHCVNVLGVDPALPGPCVRSAALMSASARLLVRIALS